MSDLTIQVVAERLDNHLRDCARQNEELLSELREFRKEVQPIVQIWQAGGVAIGLIKVIALISTTIAAIWAVLKLRGDA